MTEHLKSLVRTIPDFPEPGIMFRDVTTLFADPAGMAGSIRGMVDHAGAFPKFDCVAGIEARGFILGAALAIELGVGFVPLRKKGKLPGATLHEDYALEYGTDTLEVHQDAINEGDRVLLIDDLIATGGTALAAHRLVTRAGGIVPAAFFVIDLPELGGAAKLRAAGLEVRVLMDFDGA
ncbi:MAG: adenine phosphoribosyltransferase [Alphaproteobacteria bacterium]